MERLFVYRTAPQTKFKFTNSTKNKNTHELSQTYSQKYLQTENNQNILFKTKENILMQNYVTVQDPKLLEKPKVKRQMKRQMSQRTLRKTDTKPEAMKFHSIPIKQLTWQKWKHPQSIINSNKRNLTNRFQKRIYTQNDDRNKEERQLEEMKRQSKEKEIDRKIQELKRFKQILKQKKQVISIMNNLYEQQNKVVKKTFGEFKEQMEQMCDFYATQKFDQVPLRRIKRPQLS